MDIGLLHPGEMGVTLGIALVKSGHQVGWVPKGRSPASTRRAEQAGLAPYPSLQKLAAKAQGMVSVCPPHAAIAVAEATATAGFSGIYVDANAVSPQLARQLANVVGAGYVDGSIIGPPAHSPGTTRLYLSGPNANEVAAWFANGPLEPAPLTGDLNAAKMLKMCYAAYTKGRAALLLAIRALADSGGVTEALLTEWARSQPGLANRSEQAARSVSAKAWRFADEMREISATFEQAGLPGEFHQAATAIYERLADLKDVEQPSLDDVIKRLLQKHPVADHVQ